MLLVDDLRSAAAAGLTSLDLSHVRLGAGTRMALAALLKFGAPGIASLREINLSGNSLGGISGQCLLRQIHARRNLEKPMRTKTLPDFGELLEGRSGSGFRGLSGAISVPREAILELDAATAISASGTPAGADFILTSCSLGSVVRRRPASAAAGLALGAAAGKSAGAGKGAKAKPAGKGANAKGAKNAAAAAEPPVESARAVHPLGKEYCLDLAVAADARTAALLIEHEAHAQELGCPGWVSAELNGKALCPPPGGPEASPQAFDVRSNGWLEKQPLEGKLKVVVMMLPMGRVPWADDGHGIVFEP